jgi:hypothetical protein
MVTIDAARRFRLSSSLSREAGFRPGQELVVIANSKNTFQLVSGRKVSKKSDAPRYSVEKDGRIRVSETVLRSLGVKRDGRRRLSNFSAQVSRGSITVSL